MRYAETEDVEAAFRELTRDERTRCTDLLEEAALIVDAYNREAAEETKKLVCCRMVRRQLGEGDGGVTFPVIRWMERGEGYAGHCNGAGVLPELDHERRLLR